MEIYLYSPYAPSRRGQEKLCLLSVLLTDCPHSRYSPLHPPRNALSTSKHATVPHCRKDSAQGDDPRIVTDDTPALGSCDRAS